MKRHHPAFAETATCWQAPRPSNVSRALNSLYQPLVTLALAVGASPEQAVRISNLGAGMVVARIGAAFLTREELAGAS